MSVTLRSIFIAIILVIIAIFIYHYSIITGELSNRDIYRRFPSFTATDFSGDYFDKYGRLTYAFSADEVKYFKLEDKISLSKLSLLYNDYKQNSQSFGSWKLNASSGEVVIKSYAKLFGDVELKSTFAGAPIKQITTPSMFFDFNSNQIYSKDTIVIEGGQFKNQGSNYLVDLNKKTFVIKENSHALYHPNADGDNSKL